MVGLLEDMEQMMTLDFKNEGDIIYLIGRSTDDINSSQYLSRIREVEYSPAPYFDLEEEFALQQKLAALIRDKRVLSVHDVSEGGLFITLCEAGFNRELGFSVRSKQGIRKDAWLFGEGQSRVVVTVSPDQAANLEKELDGLVFEKLGVVTSGEVIIDQQDWKPITQWKRWYDTSIENYLMKEEASSALS